MTENVDVPSWVTLTADEHVVWNDHPSLWSVSGLIIIGLLIMGFSIGGIIFLSDMLQFISVIPFAIGLLIMGTTYFGNRSTQYVLTTEEVYKKTGIFSRNVINIRYDRIQNTSYTQSLPERILSYGSIQIDTAGTGEVELNLINVQNPEHVNGLITEQLDTIDIELEEQSQDA